MPATLLQSDYSVTGSGNTSITETFPDPTTTGSLLVAFHAVSDNNESDITGPDGWDLVAAVSLGSDFTMSAWTRIADGTETDATFVSANEGAHDVVFLEYLGVTAVVLGDSNGASAIAVATLPIDAAALSAHDPAFALGSVATLDLNFGTSNVVWTNAFIDMTSDLSAGFLTAAHKSLPSSSTPESVSTAATWSALHPTRALGLLVVFELRLVLHPPFSATLVYPYPIATIVQEGSMVGANTLPLHVGDSIPVLECVLSDAAGPIDLTDASVTFSMFALGSDTATIDAVSADILTADEGRVAYTWVAGDTDIANTYDGWFTVTYPGGAVQSFPPPESPPLRIVVAAAAG